ncbi:RECA 2 domain-containing protein [Citrus sinensis]|uniref:RECA 2 domain-containing protein n=1 Tax=Citrus sinensis TaxID=2711 RepID=A0ACB8J942_CITSI|nr:RECA 2 domain-containing protein [Citrus sinensis]
MQFPEMKSSVRFFHSPKQFLPLFNRTHFLSRQFPQFSRQFHSTTLRLCSAGESQTVPPVWSIYGSSIANGVPESSGNVNSQSSSDFEKPQVKKKTNLGLGDLVGTRKKGKANRTNWVCSDCGYTDGQWWGMCRACESVGTMKRYSAGESDEGPAVQRTWLPQKPEEVQPVRLLEVNKGMKQLDWRIPFSKLLANNHFYFSINAYQSFTCLHFTASDSIPLQLWIKARSGLFGNEVARVLGGGLVPGSLVLIGGDPGVGKSTLLLQMAAIIADVHDLGEPSPVVYVSGEESVEQIGNRADRMMIATEELFLYSSTDIEDIVEKVQPLSPRALIIDSIQTVYLRGVAGSAGGLMQVKECTSALLRFAKKTNIPVLLAGHVTKSGDIAGPRVLEHIVDAVLYMEVVYYESLLILTKWPELGLYMVLDFIKLGSCRYFNGEKFSSYRLLRSVKNRFGSTDELGVFEMSQLGLQAVSNPSKIFLSEQHSDSEFLAGLAVAVIMDGSRSFLIEIQALCVSGSTVSRHVNGIQASRADMIISAIFLNVVSGVALTETAGDLAVAAAICSSFLEFPIPNGIAFIGEIGLGGELRMVSRMEKRVSTVAKLGYRKCIVPKSAEKSLATLGFEQMEFIGCKNLKEVINVVFTTP